MYILAVLLNFLVNFLLLLGANQITGEHSDIKRTAVSAGVGGVYAAACLYWYPLGHTALHLVVMGLMSKIAFGKTFGKRGMLFMLLALSVSGIAAGLHSSNVISVLITAMGVCAMFLAGFWDQRKKLIPVQLRCGNRTVRVTALRDTGNTLRDPVSGKPVLVLGADAAMALTDLTPSELRHPVRTMTKGLLPGLRLIPYRTIDNPEGMLLGVWIKEAKVDNRRGGVLVALAPERLSEDGRFQALTGGNP